MLDPTVKEKWLTALRSGYYSQCQNALKQQVDYDSFEENVEPVYSHCCLGVLCQVQGLSELPEGNGMYSFDYKHSNCDAFLPYEFWKELNLPDAEVTIELPGLRVDSETSRVSLATLNDSGFTFSEIADVIEYFL